MKYHFKTPQQLRDSIKQYQAASHPLRNRTFLIVLADLALIVVLFGGLYAFGYIGPNSTAKASASVFGELSFSVASFEFAQGKGVSVMLYATNTGGVAIRFPDVAGEFALKYIVAEFLMEGRPGSAVVWRPEAKMVGAGATVGFRFESEWAEGGPPDVVRLGVSFAEKTLELRSFRE